ncbi:hypothetical protein [Nonomuraea rhizosphaerae]|uniref:hypothetical protein n=1 Tax=Nonomuraea rhizosphaerae TaxID=2665663 RepID=UPI001C5EAA1F|nr:hypothetical protein [Nonomuraea rhizosphaerae]
MRFTIVGALVATLALAGVGGVAITQTSSSDPLNLTGPPLRVEVVSPAATTPTATPTPKVGKYTAKTKVVKKKGVSYLDVSIKYGGAARFSVKQRVCKAKSCKTTATDLPVTTGAGQTTKKIGKGSFKIKGKPTIKVKVLPWPTRTVTSTATPTATATITSSADVTSTVTDTATSTVTETATTTVTVTQEATVTVTETAPAVTVTATATFTCQPGTEEPIAPTQTPSEPPSDTPTPTPSDTQPAPLATVPVCPTAPEQTPAPSETPTPTPTPEAQ